MSEINWTIWGGVGEWSKSQSTLNMDPADNEATHEELNEGKRGVEGRGKKRRRPRGKLRCPRKFESTRFDKKGKHYRRRSCGKGGSDSELTENEGVSCVFLSNIGKGRG